MGNKSSKVAINKAIPVPVDSSSQVNMTPVKNDIIPFNPSEDDILNERNTSGIKSKSPRSFGHKMVMNLNISSLSSSETDNLFQRQVSPKSSPRLSNESKLKKIFIQSLPELSIPEESSVEDTGLPLSSFQKITNEPAISFQSPGSTKYRLRMNSDSAALVVPSYRFRGYSNTSESDYDILSNIIGSPKSKPSSTKSYLSSNDSKQSLLETFFNSSPGSNKSVISIHPTSTTPDTVRINSDNSMRSSNGYSRSAASTPSYNRSRLLSVAMDDPVQDKTFLIMPESELYQGNDTVNRVLATSKGGKGIFQPQISPRNSSASDENLPFQERTRTNTTSSGGSTHKTSFSSTSTGYRHRSSSGGNRRLRVHGALFGDEDENFNEFEEESSKPYTSFQSQLSTQTRTCIDGERISLTQVDSPRQCEEITQDDTQVVTSQNFHCERCDAYFTSQETLLEHCQFSKIHQIALMEEKSRLSRGGYNFD